MATNEEILNKRKKHLYPNKVALYEKPIHLKRAKGSYVWDTEGNRYLDAIGGIVCISVGHNHPKIKAKLQGMLDEDDIQHTTFLYLSEPMADLAERIASEAPGDLEQCYLTNSGSEANEMAVMTARVATGEQTIISLRHGYHGGTNVPLGLCGHSTWKFPSQPQANVVHAKAPYCYRCPYGKEPGSCALECADDVKEVIETATSGKIAGIIVEPILGVGGFIDAPVEYHKKVYDIVKSYGGMYISDEVQTGVGRTGKNFFAIADSGVVPDFITMAKGIGNGAPVGAVVTKKEHADKMKGKAHFNTFGGDPYQAKQASTVIDIIKEEKLIENANARGKELIEGLRELQKDSPFIGDVRGRGLMVGLEIVENKETKMASPSKTAMILEAAKNEGLLIGKGGLYGNVIRIAPSLAISIEETNQLIEGLKKAILKIG